jgi:DNA-binding Lrp family transcriptional regulator
MSVKAYVLVVTDPGATKRVYDALRQVPGVTELHEVMGPYDIIVEIEVANLVDVPPILSSQDTRSKTPASGGTRIPVACRAIRHNVWGQASPVALRCSLAGPGHRPSAPAPG